MKFSANLGFLWADLSLPEAIRAAAASGFDAVECHWPYAEEPTKVRVALEETGLPMLGLNTTRGNVEAGENGLLALPGGPTNGRRSIGGPIFQCGRSTILYEVLNDRQVSFATSPVQRCSTGKASSVLLLGLSGIAATRFHQVLYHLQVPRSCGPQE